jgi:hypothetical protein
VAHVDGILTAVLGLGITESEFKQLVSSDPHSNPLSSKTLGTQLSRKLYMPRATTLQEVKPLEMHCLSNCEDDVM